MVALLAEGVDRNKNHAPNEKPVEVALLAEGVDRNLKTVATKAYLVGRPPRGGRG